MTTTEHAGTTGANWETELPRYETVVDDDRDSSPYGWGGWADDPTPAETASPTQPAIQHQPNRATRRRAARDARRNR